MGLTAKEREDYRNLKTLVVKLTERYNEQTLVLKDAVQEIDSLKREVNTLRANVNIANYKSDAQEQHGRKESFRLHECKETEKLDHNGKVINKEDCEKVVIEAAAAIGVEIKPEDIQRVHRVGQLKANATKPRQIICKLKSSKLRNEVIFKKKPLKTTTKFKDCFIAEDITPFRSKLLWYVRKQCGGKFVKAHTRDGKIKAKLKTDPDARDWITITTPDDFHRHNVDVNLKLINEGLRGFKVLPDLELGNPLSDRLKYDPIENDLD